MSGLRRPSGATNFSGDRAVQGVGLVRNRLREEVLLGRFFFERRLKREKRRQEGREVEVR